MQYVHIKNASQLTDLKLAVKVIAASDSMIGVDTETTGLNPFQCQVRLIQIAIPDFALVVDLDAYRENGVRQVDWEYPGLTYIKAILEGSKRAKVFQNGAFDLNFLWQEGVDVGGELHDTMHAAQLINNGIANVKNDLGSIHKRETGQELPKEEQRSDWSIPQLTDTQIRYAARDAECLTRIMPLLLDKLKKSRVTKHITLHDVYQLEQQAHRPIARIRKNGFWFDIQKAGDLRSRLQLEVHDKKNEFCEIIDKTLQLKHPNDQSKWIPRDPDGSFNLRTKDSGSVRLGTKLYKGFNPGSPHQVTEALINAGVELMPNDKGKLSMDQNLLAYLAPKYPILGAYLKMKEAITLESHVAKLIKAVGNDCRIHSNYKQLGTRSGRLSCTEPNVQQIPREKMFRELFTAAPGKKLIIADYSAMEMRMAAEISGETKMIDGFVEGMDMHASTASLMMRVPIEHVTKEQRTAGKVCNFALLYGAGAKTLQKQAISKFGFDETSWPISTSKEYVERFRMAYPELKNWQDTQGTATTEAVLTRYGRRRFLFGQDDKFTNRLNTPCQGSCGDITKIAIVMLEEKMQEDDSAKLVCTCHDELVLECEPEKVFYWACTLYDCMVNAGNLVCKKVPMEAAVGIGDDWSAK